MFICFLESFDETSHDPESQNFDFKIMLSHEINLAKYLR